jgi:hypothetical protein
MSLAERILEGNLVAFLSLRMRGLFPIAQRESRRRAEQYAQDRQAGRPRFGSRDTAPIVWRIPRLDNRTGPSRQSCPLSIANFRFVRERLRSRSLLVSQAILVTAS